MDEMTPNLKGSVEVGAPLRDGVNRKRVKVALACDRCRRRKIKCDGLQQGCAHCRKRGVICSFRPEPVGNTHRTSQSSALPEVSPERKSLEAPIGTVHGEFVGEVKAAIDARFGFVSLERHSLTPMTDAPLFKLDLRQDTSDKRTSQYTNLVLPQRKHADRLVELYWQHIYPLEPFLERQKFARAYHALFAGESLDSANERIFLCTLNTVFALSTQLQETLSVERRDNESDAYFKRAWALLRLEADTLSEPATPELVRCLLLVGRYLQCTKNMHQTWMVVGLAIRTAQSLGLHKTVDDASDNSTRQLWQCCIYMDRMVSWVTGRPPMVLQATFLTTEGGKGEESMGYFNKTMELYEIYNYITISQHLHVQSQLSNKLGLPPLQQSQDPLTYLSQLDACLDRWDSRLTPALKYENFRGDVKDSSYRQAVYLRLRKSSLEVILSHQACAHRFLHGRITLFRPMLAQFCLSQTERISPSRVLSGLLVKDCAMLCVENAQSLISLVNDCCIADNCGIGLLPWWFRVLYLHVAGTVLLAAEFQGSLTTLAISDSWGRMMTALRSHERLSPFVSQCVMTFERLWSQITTQQSAEAFALLTDGMSSPTYFQDFLRDVGFDPNDFMFGMNSIP